MSIQGSPLAEPTSNTTYRKIVIVPPAGAELFYRAMLHPLRPDGFIAPCQPIGAAIHAD